MTLTLDPFEFAAQKFEPRIPDPYVDDPVGWIEIRLDEQRAGRA